MASQSPRGCRESGTGPNPTMAEGQTSSSWLWCMMGRRAIPMGLSEKRLGDLAAVSAVTSGKGLHCRSTEGPWVGRLWGQDSRVLFSFQDGNYNSLFVSRWE